MIYIRDHKWFISSGLRTQIYTMEVGKSMKVVWKYHGNNVEIIQKLELLQKNSMEAGNVIEMAWKMYGINVEIVWNSEMVWK